MSLDSGAQTIRLGGAGPVSHLHGGATLTGCFFYNGSRFRGSRFKDSSFILFLTFHPSLFTIHTSLFLLSVVDCDLGFHNEVLPSCLVAGQNLSYLCVLQICFLLLLILLSLGLLLFSLEDVVDLLQWRRLEKVRISSGVDAAYYVAVR